MGQNYNIQMKQFNGIDFDNLYPVWSQDQINSVMSAEIIIDTEKVYTTVTATSPTGVIYNGKLSDGIWVIKVAEFGEYIVNGYGDSSDDNEVNVDICKRYYVQLGLRKVLNDNSWELISRASNSGQASSIWAVGDAKQITITGTIGTKSYFNYQTWVYILGFNHNTTYEGNNKIHFGCFRSEQNYSSNNSICLDDDKYNTNVSTTGYFSMNSSNTNSGGWKSSQMRTILLNANANSPSSATSNSFLRALPSDLKAVIKRCVKYTDNTGGVSDSASNVTSTNDWIWLLSEFEVHGQRSYANSAERNYQKQYDYYKNGNSKVKYRQSSSGSSAYWWCRSPFASDSSGFCSVGSGGGVYSYLAYFSFGVAPGFCV